MTKNFKSQLTSLLKREVKARLNKEFESKKLAMIQDFLMHPVTREISAGANSSNLSGTLGGEGNLFSFIGFESGDDPIAPIIQLLEQTKMHYSSSNVNKTSVKYRVTMPTKEQIYEISPMPWAAGRSWVHGIEHGISGLGFYLRKNAIGRSGGGIQIKSSKVRIGRFKNTSYFSKILKNFENSLNRIIL